MTCLDSPNVMLDNLLDNLRQIECYSCASFDVLLPGRGDHRWIICHEDRRLRFVPAMLGFRATRGTGDVHRSGAEACDWQGRFWRSALRKSDRRCILPLLKATSGPDARRRRRALVALAGIWRPCGDGTAFALLRRPRSRGGQPLMLGRAAQSAWLLGELAPDEAIRTARALQLASARATGLPGSEPVTEPKGLALSALPAPLPQVCA